MQVQPAFRLHQNIQDVFFRKSISEQLVDSLQGSRFFLFGIFSYADLVTDNLDVVIIGEAVIGTRGRFRQQGFEMPCKGRRVGREIKHLTIVLDLSSVGVPIDKLFPVIAILIAVFNMQVAGLQLLHHLGEYTKLKIFPMYCGYYLVGAVFDY